MGRGSDGRPAGWGLIFLAVPDLLAGQFSQDGKFLAAASADNHVGLWQAKVRHIHDLADPRSALNPVSSALPLLHT